MLKGWWKSSDSVDGWWLFCLDEGVAAGSNNLHFQSRPTAITSLTNSLRFHSGNSQQFSGWGGRYRHTMVVWLGDGNRREEVRANCTACKSSRDINQWNGKSSLKFNSILPFHSVYPSFQPIFWWMWNDWLVVARLLVTRHTYRGGEFINFRFDESTIPQSHHSVLLFATFVVETSAPPLSILS